MSPSYRLDQHIGDTRRVLYHVHMWDRTIPESLAERRIREAIRAGEFDDLPETGQPIPGAGTRDDDLWWVRSWIERNRSPSAH